MRRVRLNESQLRMVIRKIVNEQAEMPGEKIVAAYKSTGIDDETYGTVVYSWKYADGTGNAQVEGEVGNPLFNKGIKFDSDALIKPSNFIQKGRWEAKRIDPSELPV
jgi:hypothetical protein